MSETPQALISMLVDEFERRGWRDSGAATALAIVRILQTHHGELDLDELAGLPSQRFLAANRATRGEVREAIERALHGTKLTIPFPPLITIERIDSFAKAGSIAPHDVAQLVAKKLPLPEETVTGYINKILGEPYAERDWGGELGDILTTRVVLGGTRVTAAFLLKGKSFKFKLRPKDLGTNGDQVRRLSKEVADLYVVQHVGQFDEAVYDEVRDMVLARRSERGDEVVGSVWDGSDCARLFVAHGLIDSVDGEPL
jgi:hypothetical protein